MAQKLTCAASLLAIYGDNELCKKMIKVIFMISVDVIEHSGAHLTSKNRISKNLLSCLEALYKCCFLWSLLPLTTFKSVRKPAFLTKRV